MSHDSSAARMRMKRHLMSWGTGTLDTGPRSGAGTVLLESADQLDRLAAAGIAGTGTVVFTPAGAGVDGVGGAEVLEYEGPPAVPGEEIAVGDDFFLQIQDYATSAYLSVIAPALVRIFTEDDFAAFLADADTARESGQFPDFLVAAPVQLADQPGLGGDRSLDGPRLRLYVAASGEVSTSPCGTSLGAVDDGLAQLTARWDQAQARSSQPCGVCLGAVLDEESRAAQLAARPWLGRYHAAVTALRELHARDVVGAQVSGFGARMSGELAEVAEPADATDPGLPLLLWAEERAFVCRPGVARTFQVSPDLARMAELLLVTGSIERAGEHADAGQLAAVADKFASAGAPLIAPAVP